MNKNEGVRVSVSVFKLNTKFNTSSISINGKMSDEVLFAIPFAAGYH